jgi:hypothetical protein
VKALKSKIALLLLALVALTAVPVQLFADGNPIPVCNKKVCSPHR